MEGRWSWSAVNPAVVDLRRIEIVRADGPLKKGRGTTMTDDLMTSDEVAAWLRVSTSTLCRWRQDGKGPRVLWLSDTCPRYRRTDVLAWLDRSAAA